MGAVKNYFWDEIEQRALFNRESNLSEDEAFEILSSDGIDEITWSKSLNDEYATWQYLHLK